MRKTSYLPAYRHLFDERPYLPYRSLPDIDVEAQAKALALLEALVPSSSAQSTELERAESSVFVVLHHPTLKDRSLAAMLSGAGVAYRRDGGLVLVESTEDLGPENFDGSRLFRALVASLETEKPFLIEGQTRNAYCFWSVVNGREVWCYDKAHAKRFCRALKDDKVFEQVSRQGVFADAWPLGEG